MATAELKVFAIPSVDQLEEIERGLSRGINPVEQLHLSLLHATGHVPSPLTRLATVPTLGEIGALFEFADDVGKHADSLKRYADEILGFLGALAAYRREQIVSDSDA